MKTYEVKVYGEDGTYLTTWTDITGDINFNNEINTAGGQLQLTLARNAGDYGEGSDVDFNHQVKIYCFDVDEPSGKCIFQGYISSYTPIYKDNNVVVTVLGYGDELNNFIIEGGDTAYITQDATTAGYYFNTGQTSGKYGNPYALTQTFTMSANKTVSSVDLNVTISLAGWVSCTLMQQVGSTPAPSTDTYITTGGVNLSAGFSGVVNIEFGEAVALTTGLTYYLFVKGATNANTAYCKINASSANPYASGSVSYFQSSGTYWALVSAYASADIYFVLYEYGGETTVDYLNTDPTTMLTDIVSDYTSRGGHLTVPNPSLDAEIEQLASGNILPANAWGCAYAQIIKPVNTITIDAVQLYIQASAYFNIDLCQGDPSLDSAVTLGGLYAYTFGGSNSIITSTTYDATTNPDVIIDDGIGEGWVTYRFDAPQTLLAGTQYYIRMSFGAGEFVSTINCAGAGDLPINISSLGKMYNLRITANNTGDDMDYETTYPALTIRLIYINGTAPSDINGGYILTGESEDYTFRVQTMLEGVNVVKDLSPKDWYWYVDQGKNEIKFREQSTEPDHVFSLEKDLYDAKFEKRIEEVVNTIYFTGGIPAGETEALYIKYTNANSIEKYGQKALKYTDQRVTLTTTADTICNNILESKSEPELRVTLEVIDNNNEQGLGYDIESIQPGDLVAVRNVSQQVGLSTWDIARWDEAYWDYNIYNLSSLQMQVQKIDYSPDKMTITASTMPTDVSKRIEQINKGLDATQTLNNPATPA